MEVGEILRAPDHAAARDSCQVPGRRLIVRPALLVRTMGPRLVLAAVVCTLVLVSVGALAVSSLERTAQGTVAVPTDATPALDGSSGPGANHVIASLSVGKNPLPPVYDAANGNLYVANYDMTNVSVISATGNEVEATITVPAQPITPTIDTANGDLYVATQVSDSVSVISGVTNTVIGTISLGTNMESLPPVYDSSNGDLYVASAFSNTVAVISGATNTVIANLTVPGYPLVPTYDDGNGNIYVAIEGTGMVSIIDGMTNTLTANVSLGSQYLQTGAYDGANGNLYFPEIPAGPSNPPGSVVVLSGATNTVIGTVPVGKLPETPVVDSATGNLYVANYGTSNVSVISGTSNTVIGNIPTGAGPNPPTYDAGNGDLYVTCDISNNVTVISGLTNTVVTNVPVGLTPEVGSYDPATGSLFFTNKASNNVSVMADGTVTMYSATLTETGLPAGAKWSVKMDGVIQNSTQDSISFLLPNGSYPYSISATRCAATSSHGNVSLNGAAASVPVPFPPGKCSGTVGLTDLQYVEIGVPAAVVILLGALVATGRLPPRRNEGNGEPGSTATSADSQASPESFVEGATSRFRKDKRRRRVRWTIAVGGVVLIVIAAYIVFIPPISPSRSSPGSPFAGVDVHLGNSSLDVVTCGTGTSVIGERVPWIYATTRVTTAQIVMLVSDVDGDILSDTGPAPDVTASNSCAGAPPEPRPLAGVGNDFSWYVVLSNPNGTNVAFFTITQGWVLVPSGPSTPLTVANGSALTLFCTPSVSRLGPYNFEGTYDLKVGIIVNGSTGILAAVPL